MNIRLTDSLLRDYLETDASAERIAEALSLSGPTVDRLEHIDSNDVYDIEIITNRIDSASAFGIAREASAILPRFGHKAVLTNNPYGLTLDDLGVFPDNPPVKVIIENDSLVPRFTAIALSDVSVRPSPMETQKTLSLTGSRPLNNIIDVSNELTLRFGQPVHIFDLDKIKGKTMIVRDSKPGEKILTLDGRTHTLKGHDIVITDGEGRLIDLAGIMGGDLSDVDENTKNVLLFVQSYEPKRIRRTSLYTQERTLAAQIFEKRPDPELVLPTLIAGVQMLRDRAGGKVSSALIDIYPTKLEKRTIPLDLSWLNRFVGIDIDEKDVVSILNSLGFTTSKGGNHKLAVDVPSWRLHDVSIPEDLAEEITRVYGYFRLPSELPVRPIPDTQTESLLSAEYRIRKYLAHLGFTEIYNYSLISKNLLLQTGRWEENILKLQNPLSSEFEYLRPTLIPSLVKNFADNRGKTQLPLRIFEVANIYEPRPNTPLPKEVSHLAIGTLGISFAQMKGIIESLATLLHVPVGFRVGEIPAPFLQSQSVLVTVKNVPVGVLGEVTPETLAPFKLEGVVLAELNIPQLLASTDPIHRFHPISPYPPVIEDVTIASNRPVTEILEKLRTASDIESVQYVTTFRSGDTPRHTFTVAFTNESGSLTKEEVQPLKEKLTRMAY